HGPGGRLLSVQEGRRLAEERLQDSLHWRLRHPCHSRPVLNRKPVRNQGTDDECGKADRRMEHALTPRRRGSAAAHDERRRGRGPARVSPEHRRPGLCVPRWRVRRNHLPQNAHLRIAAGGAMTRFPANLGLSLLSKELVEQAARKRTYVVRSLYA